MCYLEVSFDAFSVTHLHFLWKIYALRKCQRTVWKSELKKKTKTIAFAVMPATANQWRAREIFSWLVSFSLPKNQPSKHNHLKRRWIPVCFILLACLHRCVHTVELFFCFSHLTSYAWQVSKIISVSSIWSHCIIFHQEDSPLLV